MEDARALRLLHTMVRIPSLSGEEDRLARFLVEEMNQHGFDAHVDEVGNAVGTIGDTGPEIALVGHMDTVAGQPPVRLQDGILYGRGSVDAKGPLAAFVAAASRVGPLGGVRLRVVGVTKEEHASSEGARHLALTRAPDFLVIGEPSAWDGITLGYKGYLRAGLEFETSMGHGAHAGEMAGELACRAWERVRDDASALSEDGAALYDQLLARLLSIRSEHDGLTQRAYLELALRLPPSLEPHAAESWLTERCEGARIEVQGALPAWSGPRTTPLARALARAILSHGGQPTFKRKTGTADLNILAPAWGCPGLAYGPGDAALDHTPNEHIHVDEYLRSVSILSDMLGLLAQRGETGPDDSVPARPERALG